MTTRARQQTAFKEWFRSVLPSVREDFDERWDAKLGALSDDEMDAVHRNVCGEG